LTETTVTIKISFRNIQSEQRDSNNVQYLKETNFERNIKLDVSFCDFIEVLAQKHDNELNCEVNQSDNDRNDYRHPNAWIVDLCLIQTVSNS
jgi:hypothetical protein